MQVEKKVVASIDGSPMVVDLEDFPHEDLAFVKKDSGYDIEFYNVPDGIEVASYDETTGAPEFRQVKYWSVHKGKPVEIVNLDDGRQIITDNDPRAVYGIATKGRSLEMGRFTPSDAMDNKVMVPVSNGPVASAVENMFYDFSDGLIKSGRSEKCVPLDFSFGQFVGLMAGDGWSDVLLNAVISDNEGFNADFVEQFLKCGPYPSLSVKKTAYLAKDHPDRYGDTTRHNLYAGDKRLGMRIKELVDGHGDDTTLGSANKRLPVWYQFAGRDFILGLVNGLVATDGTVCLSHGKSKPQLQISFTSTSLRLVREFRRCCQLLGVRASISFSKNTSGGNQSWICSASTIDAKRMDILGKCCHVRKREVFKRAEVQMDDMYVKNDVIPFPAGVAERLIPLVPASKTHGVDLGKFGEEEAARRRKYQSAAINVRLRIKKGSITRGLVRRIKEIGDEVAVRNARLYQAGADVLGIVEARFADRISSDDGGSRREWKVAMSISEADAVSMAMTSAKPRFCDSWSSDVRNNTNALSIIRKKGFITWAQLESLREMFAKYDVPNTELRDSEDLKALMTLVESDVSWVAIKSVEKTGKVEIGYDLTVPGPDTFVSDDGVVLSNTVSIHVPASEKAAKQALEKMLPSKNLFSLTDMRSLRYKPEKEQISGLWALTRGVTRKPVKRFSSKSEAIAAYRNGEIGPNDPVEIG